MEQEKISSRDTEKVICEIPFRLPSLNNYINECRKNRYAGAKLKSEVEKDIGYFVSKLPKFEKPIKIHFLWVEPNKKRDLDGIAFGKKFILDSMVKHGVITDDNRKIVTGFTDSFTYDKEAKVILEIEEVEE